jgi:hypothetical protein
MENKITKRTIEQLKGLQKMVRKNNSEITGNLEAYYLGLVLEGRINTAIEELNSK